jgi:hypothetical protein
MKVAAKCTETHAMTHVARIGVHVLAHMYWHKCTGAHVTAHIYWHTCYGTRVLAHMYWHKYTCAHVMAHMLRHKCYGTHVLSHMLWHTFYGAHVLAHVLALMYWHMLWHTCTGTHVLAHMYWHTCTLGRFVCFAAMQLDEHTEQKQSVAWLIRHNMKACDKREFINLQQILHWRGIRSPFWKHSNISKD